MLKSLITEPYLTIEGKYKNVRQTPNYLHIMMASNEEWTVPASLSARRWLVIDVSEAHQRDLPYFEKIQRELESGGYEALLHDLLNTTYPDLMFVTFQRPKVSKSRSSIAWTRIGDGGRRYCIVDTCSTRD